MKGPESKSRTRRNHWPEDDDRPGAIPGRARDAGTPIRSAIGVRCRDRSARSDPEKGTSPRRSRRESPSLFEPRTCPVARLGQNRCHGPARSTSNPEPPREEVDARRRHLLEFGTSCVRPLSSGAAADRRRLRGPSRRAAPAHRGRQRPAPRSLVRRQAVADAGVPARRPGAGAGGAAAKRRRRRSRFHRDRFARLMKIATFNVNGITSRLPRLLEWLGEAQPDIACLQELKTSDETFPRLEIEAAGYSAVWHGQKGFNGVAVLARGGGGLAERRRGLPGDPDDRTAAISKRRRTRRVADLPAHGNPQPSEVRLQAGLVRAADRARGQPDRAARAGAPDRRLQRGGHRRQGRHLQPGLVAEGRAAPTREPRRLPAPARPGLDRRDPRTARRRAHLYVLGLLPRPLLARCRAAHRSLAAERAGAQPALRSRCRPSGARKGKAERPRAGWSFSTERKRLRAALAITAGRACTDPSRACSACP